MSNNPVIGADGIQVWWVDGKLHRIDGPAIIHADGSQQWWVDGKKHRIDGPAYVDADGTQEWYVKDRNITNEVRKWMKSCDITYPFSNEEDVMLFAMRWVE